MLGVGPSFLAALTLLSPPSATNCTFFFRWTWNQRLIGHTSSWQSSFQCSCITSMLLSYVCPLCVVWMCLFWPAALVCSSLSVLRWLFASHWFPLRKATVSGTALICRCATPTAGETVGPPRAAAAARHRATGRTWRDLLHRRQTPNTTSTDTGRRRL